MQIESGMLLVAHPMLADPNFMRSVVYLLEHNAGGTLGLICNRPLEMDLCEIWDDCPEELGRVRICAEGGPVERERGLLLHRLDDIPGSQEIAAGIYIGGAVDSLVDRQPEGPTVDGPRLFLGHAGWSEEQLQEEIRTGSWILRPGHPSLLLNPRPPEELWKDLIGAGPARPDPSVN